MTRSDFLSSSGLIYDVSTRSSRCETTNTYLYHSVPSCRHVCTVMQFMIDTSGLRRLCEDPLCDGHARLSIQRRYPLSSLMLHDCIREIARRTLLVDCVAHPSFAQLTSDELLSSGLLPSGRDRQHTPAFSRSLRGSSFILGYLIAFLHMHSLCNHARPSVRASYIYV